MSPSGKEETFGLIRSIFWPIHRKESKRILLMLLLLFLVCTCYSILRNVKDAVILTAPASGAEAIPFLKVWGMLPGALMMTWFYTRLSRRFSREKVFYILVSCFLSYFLIFAFILYPNHEQLHLDRMGDWLTEHLPIGLKGGIALVRNWTFTTFYVIAELWAIMVLTVLYWGFINEVTEVAQAKRTYGILNVGSNIAPVLGGGLAILFSQYISMDYLGGAQADIWQRTLQQLSCTVAVLGSMAMGVFYWINRTIASERGEVMRSSKGHLSGKTKLSMRESFLYISKSPYLLCLTVIVLGYNITINITDVLWKEQLRNFFTDPNAMLTHMNHITMGIGILSTIGGLLFSPMVQRLGWTLPALLTPCMMLVMAVGFFSFLFFGQTLSPVATLLMGVTPFAWTVYFGSMQNCLSKAGKYALFDPAKELAFLPLDAEARWKGKAAIDGLGSGVGKSGASLAYQGLLVLLGSVARSTPFIAVLLFAILALWIYATIFIGKQFKERGRIATLS
jgi:AAA family ATP:ADP antiporter